MVSQHEYCGEVFLEIFGLLYYQLVHRENVASEDVGEVLVPDHVKLLAGGLFVQVHEVLHYRVWDGEVDRFPDLSLANNNL